MLVYVTKGLSLHWTSRNAQQVRVNRSISAITITSATGRLYMRHSTCIDVRTWCKWGGFLITLSNQISRLENYPIRLLHAAYVSEQGSEWQLNNIKLITHTTAIKIIRKGEFNLLQCITTQSNVFYQSICHCTLHITYEMYIHQNPEHDNKTTVSLKLRTQTQTYHTICW
jgi:hypothetical protein